MAKKPISQKRAEREKQENLALQRVFNVFLLGMAAEIYLFIVYRNYVLGTPDSLLIWDEILRWGSLAGLVLLAAGVVTAVIKRTEKKLRTGMILMAAVGKAGGCGGCGGLLLPGGGVLYHRPGPYRRRRVYPVNDMCKKPPRGNSLGAVSICVAVTSAWWCSRPSRRKGGCPGPTGGSTP